MNNLAYTKEFMSDDASAWLLENHVNPHIHDFPLCRGPFIHVLNLVSPRILGLGLLPSFQASSFPGFSVHTMKIILGN